MFSLGSLLGSQVGRRKRVEVVELDKLEWDIGMLAVLFVSLNRQMALTWMQGIRGLRTAVP
jgi:hypothetical protein